MIQMIERAIDHQGFSVIECLSECVEFFPDVFDPANPKKGGSFEMIQERKWDNTPEDEIRHDVTDELAAYKLAQLPFPASSESSTKPIVRPRTHSRRSGSKPLAKKPVTLPISNFSKKPSTE